VLTGKKNSRRKEGSPLSIHLHTHFPGAEKYQGEDCKRKEGKKKGGGGVGIYICLLSHEEKGKTRKGARPQQERGKKNSTPLFLLLSPFPPFAFLLLQEKKRIGKK